MLIRCFYYFPITKSFRAVSLIKCRLINNSSLSAQQVIPNWEQRAPVKLGMKEPTLENVEEAIQRINFYPAIAAAVGYGMISGLMSFVNKVVLTTYDYRYPDVLILAEVTVTALVLELLRKMEFIDIPCFTLKRGIQFLLPSLCSALHTILALSALGDLSIPMYNMLKRLSPLFTLAFGAFVLQKRPSLLLTTSVALIVFGCIVAGLGDLSFHFGAYTTAICSVVTQTCYLVYVQKTGVEDHLSALGVLHLNSINCIPLLTIYTLLNNRLINSINDIHGTAAGFVPAVIVEIFMGCLLNYALYLCTTMNSALTTSLVGVVKGVITTIIGFFTFGGVSLNILTLSGVLLNSFGGFIYVYSKYRDKVKATLQKEFISDHEVEVVTIKPDQNSDHKEICENSH